MKERIIRLCARGEIAINLRGLEYLQVKADEDEEAAWTRMRGKLGTGKYLNETHVLLPQAVPHTGGMSAGGTSSGTGSVSGLGGSASGGNGGTEPVAQPTAGQEDLSQPGDHFGGTTTLVKCASGATSAINLLGKMKDHWGISTGTQVRDMTLRVDQLTGAQLEKLLKNLPDGVTYELTLDKEARQ